MADWRERITTDPQIMMGKPVIAGTRLTVELILSKLAADMSANGVLEDYPFLTKADLQAALAYAAEALSSEETILIGSGA